MGSSVLADAVLEFWYVESDPSQWFRKDEHYDSLIRDRFADLIEEATRGEHDDWVSSDLGALALILVLDQFPRNIFRDDARSYAGDAKALEVSLATQARGSWIELEPDHKHFLLVPMMHSEALEVQEASLSLFAAHCAQDVHVYAVKHRDIIKRFGRFPHRNSVLGRDSTPEELEFLQTRGSSF
ncbi:MAG: DUF924 family protein [Myxococcota bacterium]|nr:DUF924 family protein [Myxococcota bacterium]